MTIFQRTTNWTAKRKSLKYRATLLFLLSNSWAPLECHLLFYNCIPPRCPLKLRPFLNFILKILVSHSFPPVCCARSSAAKGFACIPVGFVCICPLISPRFLIFQNMMYVWHRLQWKTFSNDGKHLRHECSRRSVFISAELSGLVWFTSIYLLVYLVIRKRYIKGKNTSAQGYSTEDLCVTKIVQ